MIEDILELQSPIFSAIMRTRPYIVTDTDGDVIYSNPLATDYLGITPEFCGGLIHINCDCDDIIIPFKNADAEVEVEAVCTIRVIYKYGYLIMLNDQPKPVRTESETIHQIRNGMSIMHALLDMEISTAPENEVNRLMVSQARIKAMAAVYDFTNFAPDEDVDAVKLIAAIMANTQSSFMRRQQVAIPENECIKLPAKKMLYLGLVSAEIAIHIAKHSDAAITISCSDNTITITAPVELPELPDLSQTIIKGYLGKNLNGEYQVKYDGQFRIELKI